MHAPLTLLCLPCAGASATMYLRWRRLLPHWIRIAPVELPGRGSRLGEPAVEDFGQLVSLLCAEQRQAMRGRFALLGHSMGALLAFGMARQLREEGRSCRWPWLPRAARHRPAAIPSALRARATMRR